ncbi:MAG: hypothetical protein Q9220_005228 [cf. Caloplaca sp. 1 TL-2023]
MPPIAPDDTFKPRVVCYHQTHFNREGQHVSLLPLLTEATDVVGITHLIIAAIHLNEGPGNITLNDDPPNIPENDVLWEEARIMQDVGVKVLGMLGGAAQGSFGRLDGSDFDFEAYYTPLRDMIRTHSFDGLDLDVEEEMSLSGIVRLIDRLKHDFGSSFLITMAPVARALQGQEHLSGFDYEALEVMRGSSIDCYHVQFYNNWGSLAGIDDYSDIIRRGWQMEKVVAGVLTHPSNGHGWVGMADLQRILGALRILYPRFGGVMGWEYFNSFPGDAERPWEWAEVMMKTLRGP